MNSLDDYIGEVIECQLSKCQLRITEHLIQTIRTALLIGKKTIEYEALPDISNNPHYFIFLISQSIKVTVLYRGIEDKPATERHWTIFIE